MGPTWSSFPAVPTLLLLAAGVVICLIKKRTETSGSSSPPDSPSSSSSSSAATTTHQPLPAADYEVFLSFRGPDVRTTFADFLYRFLDNSNIRTFFDDIELRKGKKIEKSLFNAIEDSKVYIPVLSSGYASSTWCLRELAHMVKCCKQGNGNILLPIFFMMEPRDVRREEGSYEKAFREHRKKFDAETVKQWKEALEEIRTIKGWHVTESHGQGAVVMDVFSHVRSHLMSSYRLVTEKLVGIDLHIEQVTNRMNQGVKVVGIVGTGGLGKTTIAMAVRDKVYEEFEYCCFLRDVRETLSGKGHIVAFQKQVLSGIPGYSGNIQDASQGVRMINDRIGRKKSLIVLDDVDERFEFQQLFGKLEDFSSESRFLITTRNRRVLDFFQHELYEPEELDHDFALQLFSRHAFGLDRPPEDRMTLSNEFLQVTTGLPLALKVIGSSLMRKNENFWVEKLKQLRKIPPAEVQERLLTSFLDLTYEEQEIFLDIASIFIGHQKEHPFYMWNACDFYPVIGVDTLILKSMIKFNEKGEFWMHDSIRDLGRAIIRGKDPWKGSRIWTNEDALDMVTNEKGNELVRILKVDMRNQTFKLTDRQFEKLSGLRYLEVSNGMFEGNFERVLPNIRWLVFNNCYLLPSDLNMKKLVVFYINSGDVRDDWSGWVKLKDAHDLKSITMPGCLQLLKAPDLSQCGNLELLNLGYCYRMSGELHIGSLTNLKQLTLTGSKIRKLGSDIAMLRNLEEMHTSFLGELPVGLDKLTKLEILTIQCSTSKGVLALPTSLKQLRVHSIHILNLLDLKNLEVLELSYYEHQLPGDIWKLSRLKTLELRYFGCKSLLAIVEEEVIGNVMDAPTCCCLPSSLQVLEIWFSLGLERLPHLANLSNLTKLHFHSHGVREIIGLPGLRMLDSFHISDAPYLVDLDGLEHLTQLTSITLKNCELERLPNLCIFSKLKTLEINNCRYVYQLGISFEVGEPSSNSGSTKRLDLPVLEPQEYVRPTKPLFASPSNSSNPMRLEFEEIGSKPLLSQELVVDLSGLHDLDTLTISKWLLLTEVIGLETLESLKWLSIDYCTSLRKLSNISGLKNLQIVKISRCEQLTEVIDLENLESLQTLSVKDCPSIKKLSVSSLEHLKSLDMTGCTQLIEVAGLEILESLRLLRMTNCMSIEKLPNLSSLKHLQWLEIPGCTRLTEVVGAENLKELNLLIIDERLEISPLKSGVRIVRK